VKQSAKSQSGWPTGVLRLLADVRMDVNEVLAGGEVTGAIDLSRITGLSFESKQFPMYFTGDFTAPLVMVHLNPKLSDQLDDPGFESFEDYLYSHEHFGHIHWELNDDYKSNFDRKQVRFVKPFDVIDFLEEEDPRADRSNPARVIDRKLQLELIPYASPDFSSRDFPFDYLELHFKRVLDVIAAFPRRYVLFCGAVFDDLLTSSSELVRREEHRFHLKTIKGTSKAEYRFSNVVLQHNGEILRAGVARSFATQGLPMDAYGAECYALYATQDIDDEPARS
jgi:hypothetical protein